MEANSVSEEKKSSSPKGEGSSSGNSEASKGATTEINKNETKNDGTSGSNGGTGATGKTSEEASTSGGSSSESGQSQASRVPVPPKPWHNAEADEPDRNSLVEHIVELLKLRKPNENKSWHDKLPQMAKRLDDALYFSAPSKAEYIDRTTLKHRLQQLASAMGGPKSQRPADAQASSSGATQAAGQQGQGAGAPAAAGASGAPRSQQSEEHRREVLKQQQQRLLLLRHASKCPYEAGKCPITTHCANMKSLWKHIMGCKDQNCSTPHCVSSRYVLSHYSKCKEETCPVCGPVKEAIRRKYEQSRQVINMAQGNGKHGTARQMQANYMNAKRPRIVNGQQFVVPQQYRAAIQKFPLDPVSCPLYCFTADEVDNHFKTIHEGMRLTAAKIREICLPILDEVLKEKYAYGVFGNPVDPVALGLTDYEDIVKMPMDMGTIRKKLDLHNYRDLETFCFDMNLCFDNAMLYNPKTSDVFTLAKDLKKQFENIYKRRIALMESSVEAQKANPDNCLICGSGEVKFEPPVYYCNGRCGGQRIRRNAWYYHTNRDDAHWCTSCFHELRDSPQKRELANNKKKHDKESDETWVQCDGGCERWAHQICSLFNGRRNLGDDTSYICPHCFKQKKIDNPTMEIVKMEKGKKIQANELPHTTMTMFLENRLQKRLEKAYEDASNKMHCTLEEVEKCPRLALRQVCSQDKQHQVRELFKERYGKEFPAEFPVRSKCMCLFQNIDGQDVVLFAMYVYEYGHKCPAPNQRRVYISYLDSVHYLRPRQYRTLIYHEIIISYLDYVKMRGFHSAHIWACPPLKGDDYIFHIHPQDQKTPKDDKLRKWYADLLQEAKERGIVTEISDLYTEFLKDASFQASCLPYFDGDYIASEAEVIIKDLKAGKLTVDLPVEKEKEGEKEGEKDDEEGDKTKRAKAKARRPTRSAGVKLTDKGDRDPIMTKLASIIEPMKEAFFVCRLHPKEYADECAARRAVEVDEEAKTAEEEQKKAAALKEEALSGDVAVNVPKESASKEKAQATEEGDDFAKSAAGMTSTEDSKGENNDAMDVEDNAKESRKKEKEEEDEDEKEQPKRKKAKKEETEDETPATPRSSRSASAAAKADSGGRGRGGRKGRTPVKKEEEEEEEEDEKEEDAAEEKEKEEEKESKEKSKKGAAAKKGKKGGKAVKKEKEEEEDEEEEEKGTKDESDEKKEGDDKMVVVKEEPGVEGEDKGKDKDKKEGESEGEKKDEKKEESYGVAAGLDENGVPVCFKDLKDDTEDVDDLQENEHFDSRLSFLNLCTGNHYQFDQLRRAKHSSMMVLYHLHNPDAPKFVPSCALCHKEVIQGYRHNCPTCAVDFCHSCYSVHGPRLHPQHPLRPIPVSGGAPVQLTEEQRRERQRSIQLHLELLLHASTCNSTTCTSRSCQKMKDLMRHEKACKITAQRGCRDCLRMNSLLTLHARSCKLDKCAVPKCHEIRERIRQMTLRQQSMDDRRRAMMNDMYSRAATQGMSGADDHLQ